MDIGTSCMLSKSCNFAYSGSVINTAFTDIKKIDISFYAKRSRLDGLLTGSLTKIQ